MSALLYRIDHPARGLWYRPDGRFDPFIFNLKEAKAKDFPMDYDSRYAGGWISACKNLDNMRDWFSREDALELIAHGFSFYQIESSEYRMEPMQALFTRKGVIRQVKVPLDGIWA